MLDSIILLATSDMTIFMAIVAVVLFIISIVVNAGASDDSMINDATYKPTDCKRKRQ